MRGWGVAARVVAPRASLLDALLLELPSGFSAGPPPPGRRPRFELQAGRATRELYRDGTRCFAGRSWRRLQRALLDELFRLASTDSGRYVFLHAGGVEIAGRALLLPGASGAGKSTLVAELLRRGARYLSDDLVPIDARLRAQPFPRPLTLRQVRGHHRLPALRPSAARARGPLAVAAICCLRYRPGPPRTRLLPLAGGPAFAALLAHAPGVQVRPGLVVPVLTRLAATVPVLSGTRGDAAHAADRLFALMGA